jgi:acetylornithine deacetylase/succinyl-diaminopimelate desuccinylase-like protein
MNALSIITDKATIPGLKDLAKMAIETHSPTSGEKDILDKLQGLAEGLASAPTIIRGDFGLVVIWEGASGKNAPLYLFDGHVDNVSVKEEEAGQWLSDPFEAVFKEEEGKEYVYGKGAVDQQGGYLVAFKALVETLEQINVAKRSNSIGIVFARAEEVAEGFASEKIHHELLDLGYDIRGVIITEPSFATIMTGQMGRLRLKIKDHDKNPVALAALISRLYTYERMAKVTGEKQALTLIGGDLRGDYTGTIDSQVPDRAVIKCAGGDELKLRLKKMKEEGHLVDYSYGEGVIELKGRTAHSAFPWKGVNAGVALADLLVGIEGAELVAAHIGDGGIDVTADGGVLYYDYRIDFGESPESFIESLREHCAKELELMPNLEIGVSTQEIELDGKKFEVYQYFPAWELGEDSLLLPALKTAAMAHYDLNEVPVGAWGFCTNGSGWTKKKGLELIGIGPGDPTLSHQPNERCPMGEMVDVCSLLQRFIADFI